MKIDIFPHILPKRFFDRMLAVAPPTLHLQKRMRGIPVLVDLAERLRIMDRYEGYAQVLTLVTVDEFGAQSRTAFSEARFVPLRGTHGFDA